MVKVINVETQSKNNHLGCTLKKQPNATSVKVRPSGCFCSMATRFCLVSLSVCLSVCWQMCVYLNLMSSTVDSIFYMDGYGQV